MPCATRLCARALRDVGAVEDDRAGRGDVRAGDRPQERRLAGAVGADQRDDLGLIDGERHFAHRLQQAVAHVEPFDPDEAHAAPLPR